MPKLIAPAKIHVWGWGCESSTVVKLRCEPLGGGAFVSIEAHGKSDTRCENLLLDEIELQALLVAVTDADLSGRAPGDDFPTGNSAVGQVNIDVPLESGRIEHMVNDGEPHRLVALADFLLALTERAGITLSPAFHPLGTR